LKKEHHYRLKVHWTGNKGSGTSNYKAYERSHLISAENKPDILATSDPAFRGDPSKYNPEELLLASLSSCHMLWFLHLCAENGVVVLSYSDNPEGTMIENENGSGKFAGVVLHPQVTVTEKEMIEKLDELHEKANQYCFIANSVNFPVRHFSTGIVS
jgi:organic hydroperoxide reductase OsmC/OhrA